MSGAATTDSDTSRQGMLQRVWSAPFGTHVAVLALALALAVAIVGEEGVFSSDEGAGLAQASAVSDGHWGVPHAMPALDPSGRWFALEDSAATSVADAYAPLPKKPVYSWVASRLWPAGGAQGLMALSAAGTLVAATVAGLLARTLDPRLDRAALWVAGLVSPLLADGLLVIAHTLAAAMAALAVLGVVRWRHSGRIGWALTVVGGVGIATLLRAEALLLAAALVASLVLLALVRREGRLLVPALLVAGGAGVAVGVDAALTRRLFGSTTLVAPAGTGTGDSFLANRVHAFVVTWLRPGYDDVGAPQLIGILLVMAGLVAVFLTRRGEDAKVLRVVCLGVAGLAVARLVVRAPDPDVVSGLLLAFPLLAWGLAGLGRAHLQPLPARLCGLTFGIFSAAVIATQYREGGAWEWGGRYFAVGLPLIVPLVVVGGRAVLDRFDAVTRSVALAALVTVGLSVAAMQVLAVRYSHVRGHDLVERALEVADRTLPGDGGLPVIISAEPELPRGAWAELDEARWLYVPLPEVPEALERLAAVGVDHAVLATHEAPDAVRVLPQLARGLDGAVPPAGLWWFEPVSTP